MQVRRLVDHPGRWMVGSQTLLGVPPHRVARTFRIHDDGRVGTIGDRGAIGVVEVIAGVEIARMPTVDHQRRRSGAEIVDVLMQQIELMGDAVSWELEQPLTKPVLCTSQTALFTRVPVDRAVRQCVRVPRYRYGRVSPEGRQARQRAVEAVVGAPRDGVSTIIDEVPVVVCSWVGVRQITALRISKRIFHRRLIGGILKVV
jgi:hypothetical protein